MKTLLLMRHAKSSWKDEKLEDHQRPLKKRGRKDAKAIAEVMRKNDLLPDLIISSTALRAVETAEVVAKNLSDGNQIVALDNLYMGEPQDFINDLKILNNDYNTVMIVAHNPGLEAYLQIIDGEIESVPTGALGHLTLVLDDWKDISLDTMGELVSLWKPKDLRKKEENS
jgi:phosphohistidine phosphatase